MKHCRWCGVFVSKETTPTPGINAYGQRRDQLVCPGCRPQWLDLSRRNAERLDKAGIPYDQV
jgi:hypothetical protein